MPLQSPSPPKQSPSLQRRASRPNLKPFTVDDLIGSLTKSSSIRLSKPQTPSFHLPDCSQDAYVDRLRTVEHLTHLHHILRMQFELPNTEMQVRALVASEERRAINAIQSRMMKEAAVLVQSQRREAYQLSAQERNQVERSRRRTLRNRKTVKMLAAPSCTPAAVEAASSPAVAPSPTNQDAPEYSSSCAASQPASPPRTNSMSDQAYSAPATPIAMGRRYRRSIQGLDGFDMTKHSGSFDST